VRKINKNKRENRIGGKESRKCKKLGGGRRNETTTKKAREGTLVMGKAEKEL